MKITQVELFHIAIPFATPYKLSKAYGTLDIAHAIIFKVHTDEGLVGFGEADPMNPFCEDTPGSVIAVAQEMLIPRLLGQDPMQIRTLESAFDQCVLGHLNARAAVNMALYDLVGKASHVPVHVLLGGLRHRTLEIWEALGSGTPEEDRAIIERKMAQGYKTFMLKMGVLPISAEIKRVAAVRKQFGDTITLLVDVNQGWDFAQTREFINGVRDFPPDLMEQPVPRWDIDSLKKIHDMAPCMLSCDESLSTVHDAATLIRERAVDAFSIKVSKNGGLDKSRQIATLADAFGLQCIMNSMFEFGITQAALLQLGCTLCNLADMGHSYFSVLRMSDDVTDFARNISGATITVPSAHGLGVAVDEDKLRKYTLDHVTLK